VRTLVVGIGNPERGDDGVGPQVSDRVSERVRALAPGEVEVASLRGDLFGLLDCWGEADTVVLVDAMRAGAAPGTVRRIALGEGEAGGAAADLGAALASFASSHSVDLAQALALAESLDRLPPRLVLYGIEAAHFEMGRGLSPAVAAAVEGVVARILEEVLCTRPL